MTLRKHSFLKVLACPIRKVSLTIHYCLSTAEPFFNSLKRITSSTHFLKLSRPSCSHYVPYPTTLQTLIACYFLFFVAPFLVLTPCYTLWAIHITVISSNSFVLSFITIHTVIRRIPGLLYWFTIKRWNDWFAAFNCYWKS